MIFSSDKKIVSGPWQLGTNWLNETKSSSEVTPK